MRKPALAAMLFYVAGSYLQAIYPIPWVWGLGTAVGMFLVCILAFGLRRLCEGSLFLGLLLALLGALRFGMTVQQTAGDHYMHHLDGREVVVAGVLASEPDVRDRGWQGVLSVSQLCVADTVWSTSGRLLIRFSDSVPLAAYGDSLCVRVLPHPAEPPRNPGGFDYRQYLLLRGIQALATVGRSEQVMVQISGEGGWWADFVLPVRNKIREAIEYNLSGGPAGLLKGILLGDKRAVPEDVRAAFTRCGVNHVLAVSGLHVGLIAGVVFFGLRLCGVGRTATVVITVGALIGYALVTNLPPSVIRASVMAGVVLLGNLAERDTNGWNALGIAGLVGAIARPADVLDVGFQLSFAATGGILLFYRPFADLLPKWGGRFVTSWITGPLAVSFAAQASTMPFVVTYFGIVSFVGIVANLIVVPLIGVSAALGLIGVLLFMVAPSVAALIQGANWVVLKGAIELAQVMATPAWAAIVLPHLPVYQWVIYGLGLLLVLPVGRQQRMAFWIVAGILVCANYGAWQGVLWPGRTMAVYVLDVGQGDGIFIRFPGGRTMLIDGGIRTQHTDMGARVVLPFLRSMGISHIDVVVGSHPHSDHIGGLLTILDRVKVDHYIDGGQKTGSWTAKEIHRLIQRHGITYHAVAAGDSLVGLGPAGALVLHPGNSYVSNTEEAPSGLNNGSVVMRIAYMGQTLLLTGDIEHETDGALLRWGHRLQADVLKAAHHGSRTSSTKAFLTGVHPGWVLVSCGINNKFRHPSPEVIQRYQEMGMQVLRTDLSGAVQLVVGEQGIEIKTWLEEAK